MPTQQRPMLCSGLKKSQQGLFMGTYCYYRLGIIDKEQNPVTGEAKHALIQALLNDPDVDKFEVESALTPEGDCAGESKWYDSDKHMQDFCKKHPDYSFILGMELCVPESEEEEGEIFTLFNAQRSGTLRGEPDFMHEPKLFSSVEALEENLSKDERENEIVFSLSSRFSSDIKLWQEKLKQTAFKDRTQKSFSFSSFGSGCELAITVKTAETDEFWSEAKRVLIY